MSRIEELIAKSQAGDETAKETLVIENSGLIWSVARRFMGKGIDTDDMYQLACLGFLKAIEGFDLSYGTQFSTYAVPKIAGEIRRFLRDDGAIKVSRGIKERAMTVKTARNQLLQERGYEPTVEEIAEVTMLTPEDIAFTESATANIESIHQVISNEGFTLESILTDTDSEETLVERLALRQAIEKLPPKEATVIKLRYFHALTQERVAKVMNVSQVQISRIEKKGLEKLREFMMQ